MYSEVTRACRFKISRHEGKITGLAAYGNYKKYEDCFDKLVEVKDGQLIYVNPVQNTIVKKVQNKLSKLIGSQKKYFFGAAELIKKMWEIVR